MLTRKSSFFFKFIEGQFTYDKTYPFKVNSLVNFGKYIHICNHPYHYNQDREHFYNPKKFPYVTVVNFLISRISYKWEHTMYTTFVYNFFCSA